MQIATATIVGTTVLVLASAVAIPALTFWVLDEFTKRSEGLQ